MIGLAESRRGLAAESSWEVEMEPCEERLVFSIGSFWRLSSDRLTLYRRVGMVDFLQLQHLSSALSCG